MTIFRKAFGVSIVVALVSIASLKAHGNSASGLLRDGQLITDDSGDLVNGRLYLYQDDKTAYQGYTMTDLYVSHMVGSRNMRGTDTPGYVYLNVDDEAHRLSSWEFNPENVAKVGDRVFISQGTGSIELGEITYCEKSDPKQYYRTLACQFKPTSEVAFSHRSQWHKELLWRCPGRRDACRVMKPFWAWAGSTSQMVLKTKSKRLEFRQRDFLSN